MITPVVVYFKAEYENHPLKSFQADGHFVPGLREEDAEGNATRQPRKWKGTRVHALTLKDADGKQILRSLADSEKTAGLMLAKLIQENFWGAQRALAIAEFNAEQARKVKDERDRLVAWMLANGQSHGVSQALGIAEGAVEEYRAKEAALRADPSPVNELLRGAL